MKKRRLAIVLNEHGFFWKRVPRTLRLSPKERAKRKTWVEKYRRKSAVWWEKNMNLVLDGVTLTMPPPTLDGRQKHAAQRITSMWLREGEAVDPNVHTHNRYGVQLGVKVHIWGDFTGGGKFTLRLWTPRPKMTKQEWEAKVPGLKRAADTAEARAPERRTKRAKVWHDNEKFLLCPTAYKQHGLSQVRFPQTAAT